MASSLASLASNLFTGDYENFRETRQIFNSNDLSIITRKDIYPYEYTDNWEILDEDSLERRFLQSTNGVKY